MNNTKKKPTIKELINFRERVRVELLGQTDPEYREEVRKVLIAVDEKIRLEQHSARRKFATIEA